jgi:hypothetical protein
MLRARGRPSNGEQVKIGQELRPYFERSMTATYTANRTGYDIKTVCAYFDGWTREILQVEEKDFLERQKKERHRTLLSIDLQLDELYQTLDDINQETKRLKGSRKTIRRYLFATRLETLRLISNLTEKRGMFAMLPTVQEALEERSQEKKEEPKDDKESRANS